MQTKSPILFIVFNRPDVTAKVFAAIREARPPRLYVSGDGARASRPGEGVLCDQARAVATQVDWPCELHTKFNDKNLGCKEGVVSGLNWFFEHEAEGIILEDDCLPSPDFFRFCDTLLDQYRHDTRVRHVGGANFQRGDWRGPGSYYFSRLTHIWGWASWRRVWRDYDKDLAQASLEEVENALQECFHDADVTARWLRTAADLKDRKIDTWDYQLSIAGFLSHGVAAIPNVNLISNIGFGEHATHTRDSNSSNANLPLGRLPDPIIHPRHVVPSRAADLYTLNAERPKRRLKHRLARLLKRRPKGATS